MGPDDSSEPQISRELILYDSTTTTSLGLALPKRRRTLTTDRILTGRRHASNRENHREDNQTQLRPISTVRTRYAKQKATSNESYLKTTTCKIYCAGANKQKSKLTAFPLSLSSTTTIISGIGTLVYKAKGSRVLIKPNTGKTTDIALLSNPHSTILNVGKFEVASTTEAHRIRQLLFDSLSCWNMDLTSLSACGSTTDNANAVSNSANPTLVNSNDTLFSTIEEDDSFFPEHIPFPININRHSRVVLENMGVKKSKQLAKERSISGVRTSKRVMLPRFDPPPSDFILQSRLNLSPDLPNSTSPIPPQPNTASSNPLLIGPSIPRSLMVTDSISRTFAGPSSFKKDVWGSMHLGAADCELSILFPQTSHFEIWDVGDSSNMGFPAMLCLLAKDASLWSGKPLALPDVTRTDIRCEDVPIPNRHSLMHDRSQKYSSVYSGANLDSEKDKDKDPSSSSSSASTLGSRHGHRVKSNGIQNDSITVDGKWIRTYNKPGVDGSKPFRLKRRSGDSSLDHRSGIGTGLEADQNSIPSTPKCAVRGWYLKIWVPIPASLLEKRETRAFSLFARIWMMGDERRVLSLEGGAAGGCEKDQNAPFPLLAETVMTVSHLRKEREMEIREC